MFVFYKYMKYLKQYNEKLENFKDLQFTPQEYKKLEDKYILIEFISYNNIQEGEKEYSMCKVLNVDYYDFKFTVEFYQYEDEFGGYGALSYTYNYSDMKKFKIVGIFDSFKEVKKELEIISNSKKYNL